jgi:hypothetical protein
VGKNRDKKIVIVKLIILNKGEKELREKEKITATTTTTKCSLSLAKVLDLFL